LSEKEIAVAISSTFGISVDNKLTSRITQESGGNPLFALELVRYLSETDAFQNVNGTWLLGIGVLFDVPSNIRDLIIRRVERLTKEQRRILELASVVGGPFTASLLEEIISAPRGSMTRAISEMAHRQLMLSESNQLFRFSHEQIRRVTYEQVSEMRRKELHHLVGEYLEGLPDKDYRYGELALHFDQAGQQNKALKYSLFAGEECLRRMAMMESIPFFERVLKGTKENDARTKCRIRALEGLGTAQLELSNYDTAARYFNELLTFNPDPKTKARSLRKCAECYGPTRLGKGSSADLLRLCEEAESIPEIERSEVGEIWHYRAMVTTWEGRPEDAEKYAIESEKIFREVGPIERLAIQLTYNLTIDITIGNVGIAIEKAREIWDLYREHPYPSGELELLNYLGIALLHQGRYSEAKVTLQRSIDLAEKLGDYPLVCWGYIYLAMVYEGMCEMDAASDLAQEARERALLTESPYLIAASNSALARHLIDVGKIKDAEPLVNEAKEITKEFQWAIKTPTRGLIELAAAQLCDSENMDPYALFENAESHLQGAAFALYLEGNAFLLHGLSLRRRGFRDEGDERCRTALDIFKKIGNEEKVMKIIEMLEN
jgi:tetratricopeptide (TPR) repeat protein